MNPRTIRIACDVRDTLPLDELQPFQGNLKDLTDDQYEHLKREILETGFAFPVYYWRSPEGVSFIIGGHQRCNVLKKMREDGFEIPPVPVVQVFAESFKQAKRRVLQDVSQYGQVTTQGLYEFSAEAELGPDELFESFRIPDINEASYMKEYYEDNSVPPDESEDSNWEPQPDPITKRGDVWTLGDHRLVCGDSTMITDVELLMTNEKADMVFTDPPYGVNYEGGHNKKKRQGIKNDQLEGDSLTDLFYESLLNAQTVSKDHAAFYIWYANGKAVETFASFSKLALDVRAVICWYKVRSGLGAFMSQYIPNYEPCIYAFKMGCSPQWFGPSDEKTVWELQRTGKNEFHPTQKPVDLAMRALKNSSRLNDAVLDLFGGSGATLIACETENRRCFMMELDPRYCDVILKRWSTLTGKDPVRDDGALWSNVSTQKN